MWRLLALLCCVAAAAAAGPGAEAEGHHHHHEALHRAAGSPPRRALHFQQYAPEEGLVGLLTGFTVGAATTAATGGNLLLGLAAGTAAGGGAAINTGLVLAGVDMACQGCVPKVPVPLASSGPPTNPHSTG